MENRVLKKLFPYDKHDRSTWPYLTCVFRGTPRHLYVIWVKNPEFKYGHLIKNY